MRSVAVARPVIVRAVIVRAVIVRAVITGIGVVFAFGDVLVLAIVVVVFVLRLSGERRCEAEDRHECGDEKMRFHGSEDSHLGRELAGSIPFLFGSVAKAGAHECSDAEKSALLEIAAALAECLG